MRISNSSQIILLPLLVLISVNAKHDYTIKNKCPIAVDLYINGWSEGTIRRKAKVDNLFAEDWAQY
jgi:hypothetical protein